MTGEGATLELSGVEGAPELSLSWKIVRMTDAPEGKFLLFDAEGEPRLIVDGEELSQLTAQGAV